MSVLSTRDAAQKLQVSPDTVLRWIKSNDLPATRIGKRGHWRIRQTDLEQFAETHGVELLKPQEK